MKKNIQFILAAVAALLCLTFSSCKKDKDITPEPVTYGTLMFHLHNNVDTSEVEDYDSVYTMTGGRKISVSIAQLYITGIQLVKLDGSTYDIVGATLLKKQDNEVYTVGNVPAGNYKSVKFKVGLGAATNATTPVAGDVILDQPQMWFDATAQPSGFVFLNFQGKIDTTTSATATIAEMQSFSYKIGTNANLKSVSMPDQNYTVTPNQVQYVHMSIDYNKLFTGIPLNVPGNLTMNTTAANTGTLAMQLTNNIPLMFSYEE